jgi:hypothetical protein
VKTIFLILLLAAGGYVGYLAHKEKPGVGPKARVGKVAAQPVITAVEAYRTAHNMYPADIDDLLTENTALPRRIDGHEIGYSRHGSTYDLTFSYTTPLPVHCTYSPTHWKCGYM